jgi:hypothetical protein
LVGVVGDVHGLALLLGLSMRALKQGAVAKRDTGANGAEQAPYVIERGKETTFGAADAGGLAPSI